MSKEDLKIKPVEQEMAKEDLKKVNGGDDITDKVLNNSQNCPSNNIF